MYSYFNGILSFCALNTAVVECGGVGYKLTVSAMTLGRIAGKEGSKVKLFAYLAVREDAMELFGFADEEEAEAFRLLIGVSGIGPKAAIAILSVFTPEKLQVAIASGDTKAIARAQGIGAKTAARVVLELKDKFKFFGEGSEGEGMPGILPELSPAGGAMAEASDVLEVLGYSRPQIAAALKGADPTWDSETLVKYALKQLAGGR